MNWVFLLPALLGAFATCILAHETMVAAEDNGRVPVFGVLLTVAAALSTVISVGAILP